MRRLRLRRLRRLHAGRWRSGQALSPRTRCGGWIHPAAGTLIVTGRCGARRLDRQSGGDCGGGLGAGPHGARCRCGGGWRGVRRAGLRVAQHGGSEAGTCRRKGASGGAWGLPCRRLLLLLLLLAVVEGCASHVLAIRGRMRSCMPGARPGGMVAVHAAVRHAIQWVPSKAAVASAVKAADAQRAQRMPRASNATQQPASRLPRPARGRRQRMSGRPAAVGSAAGSAARDAARDARRRQREQRL